jgi:beta-lactamase class A
MERKHIVRGRIAGVKRFVLPTLPTLATLATRTTLTTVALVVAVAATPPLQARQKPAAADLEASLRAIIAASGAEVAVAFRTIDGRSEVLIEPDLRFHAASTMKVPVMIELYRQAASGTLSLTDTLPIRNEFRSIVDGSPYALSVGADSDKVIYAAIGKALKLRELCEAMITVSSNFAANLLIERLGVENIRASVSRLGADGMEVLRGVEDQKAFEKNLNNSTTARALLVLFEKLGHGAAVGGKADVEMIAVLKRQRFNDGIPAGLPPKIAVAHKTGNITRIHHDAGIVYAKRPYVLVVLVRGIQEQKASASLIAKISKAVYASTSR